MIYAFVNHPVRDYDLWKPVFDSDAARASAAGIRFIKVLRGVENPNSISIFCSAPNQEEFDAFFHDPILPELMKDAGVLAPPTVQIFNEA